MNACQLSAINHLGKSNGFVSWRGLLGFEKNLFVIVNVMDVIMTHLLLRTGAFYESNPLANYILNGWGMLGMTAFKLALVAMVLLIVNIVAIWQVNTSRNVLNFGSLIVGGVVAYSTYLMLAFQAWN